MKIFTAQKKKFSINNFFSNYVKPQETADLVTFTEKIFNAKFIFCTVISISFYSGVRKWFSFVQWISEYAAFSPSISPRCGDLK